MLCGCIKPLQSGKSHRAILDSMNNNSECQCKRLYTKTQKLTILCNVNACMFVWWDDEGSNGCKSCTLHKMWVEWVFRQNWNLGLKLESNKRYVRHFNSFVSYIIIECTFQCSSLSLLKFFILVFISSYVFFSPAYSQFYNSNYALLPYAISDTAFY